METSYFYTCNYVIINTLKLKKGEDEENVAREIEHTFIKFVVAICPGELINESKTNTRLYECIFTN